jgi:hypothetical protein
MRVSRPVLRAAFAVSAVALAVAGWQAAAGYLSTVSSAKSEVIGLTVKGAAQIDAELGLVMKADQTLADDLAAGRLSYDAVGPRLKSLLLGVPSVHSISVSFAPGAYKPGVRLHSPHWVREDDGPRERTDASFDYTKPEELWYARAVASGKPVWIAPFYRQVSNSLSAIYAVPFYRNGKVAGVAAATVSLDEIKRMVETLDLGPSGFGELISADGTYLYHPRNEVVLGQKTILDLAGQFKDKDRLDVAPRARRGEGGVIDHVSTTTGLPTWFVFEPVAAAGWSLQVTYVRADLTFDVDAMRRRFFRAILAAIFFLLLLASLYLRVEDLGRRDLWTLSIVSSLLFAGGVGLMWFLTLKLDEHSKSTGTVVSDLASLERLRSQYVEQCAALHAEPPIFVPTGAFLETARFVGPADLLVTGYIWQKYEDRATRGLDRGFILRDASDIKISEPYRQRDGAAEVYRWPFQAILHEEMHLAKYPLDQEVLALKLRHKDIDHNVVLTPDIASYKIIAATAKPGLAAEFKISGWRVLRSYFGLGGKIDTTTFGLSHTVSRQDFPGLQYNVLLRRNLLDAFISNLSPIIIALILLFALQMVMTSDEKLASFMQTTSGRLVNICVSMFFVIVFAHVSVRRGMTAEEIFYLEYFYFITYLMILWVAINSIVYYKLKQVAWLQYEENLVLKLLFWPTVTGLLLAATTATFY